MPIFEFLCPTCNRIYSFLSLSLTTARKPTCPRCGSIDLSRVPSLFAVPRGKKAAPAKVGAGPERADDFATDRMEQEMMQMVEGLDEKDAENPRVMGRMMRRLAENSGEPITPTMEEMFRRMEAGEDPETLDDELGPQLEAEMGEADGGVDRGAPTRDEGLYDL